MEKSVPGYAEFERESARLHAQIGELQSKQPTRHSIPTGDKKPQGAPADLQPLTISEVQSLLAPAEALTTFLIGRDGAFGWVVTQGEKRWTALAIDEPEVNDLVLALRCGLDGTSWERSDARERCVALLKGSGLLPEPVDNDKLAEAPPFDLRRAHRLYEALLQPVEDLIKGKHLLIVPSGPVTQLPLQVLVTRPPASRDYRAAAWLAREHAVTVLPAASSLKALRRVGRPSSASRPMIGFGNPLLAGHPGDKEDAELAKQARARQRCAGTVSQRLATRAVGRGGVVRAQARGGVAHLAQLHMQAPLPETADELCTVAQAVKAEPADIRLGAQATEREVKRLNTAGELARYRIVHFATHGVLAGELAGTREPGLILTPPAIASDEDDGYLSASEIAGLKLDADWVVLSACNTAAGGTAGAEALSGLARAFFYAQARALLVSHWAVSSNATVTLVTGAVEALARDPRVGRAEAMRRSMLALIDKGSREEAHPSVWAPFVVVGEGAAGR